MIRVTLVRAWPGRHEAELVELPPGATVADALAVSGWMPDGDHTGLAIFGRAASHATRLEDGDRVELLRRLERDPKQARRLRAERAKDRDPRTP
jgi:putative ubiquitin-RnfH superfamily antitoxin RatB of RatAB toxin-antitoxin module